MTEPKSTGAQESSRIGINFLLLALSRAITLLLGFVQVGIIFRALTVEAAGQFGFALSYASLFSVFATFGIHRLLVRDIARDQDSAWTYVWTAEALIAFVLVFLYGVIALSITLVDPSGEVRWAVWMAALSVVVIWALQQPFESLLIARERISWLATVGLVSALLKLASVYIALQHNATSATAHGAIAVANLVGFIFCIGFTIRVAGWSRPRIQLSLIFRQIRECRVLLTATIFSLLYFKSDLVLLAFFQGDVEAGLYTLVQRISEPLMMFASLLATVVFPALCRFSADPQMDDTWLKAFTLRLALLMAVPLAIGLALLAAPAIGLLTGENAPEYRQSVILLRLTCVVIPLFYLNGVAQEFLYAANRDRFVAKTYCLAALVSVGLNVLLMPRYGVQVAPLVAIAANGTVTLTFAAALRHEYRGMNLPMFVVKTTCASLGMALASFFVMNATLFGAVGIGIAVYAVLLVAMKTLGLEERALLRQIMQRFARKA